ncbi:MAG: ribose-phosphate pyrophosphokinase [Chlamydiales bacterium]|nr:ribose-phosphate pyrophosphokinase [Chlamydiales bacterium]
MPSDSAFMLFAGTSHPEFAQELAKCLGVDLGKAAIETFPDGEIGARILESVRGRDVFVLQSIARRPSFYLMELLILVDALKRSSARSINVVISYFGYARQDRRGMGREPITAKLVANLLEKAGVSRVLTMDLHTEQIQGFFDIPVDNLYARQPLLEAVAKLQLDNCVVVTPDVGSIRLARSFAEALKVDLAIVDKRRVSARQVEMHSLIGDVKGRDVLIVDDMCSTGGTLKTASVVCRKAGAKRIFAAVTHGLLLGDVFEESAIEKMLITNTIPPLEGVDLDRIEVS